MRIGGTVGTGVSDVTDFFLRLKMDEGFFDSTWGVSFGGGSGCEYWSLVRVAEWAGLLLGLSEVSADVVDPWDLGGSDDGEGVFRDEPKTRLKKPGRSLGVWGTPFVFPYPTKGLGAGSRMKAGRGGRSWLGSFKPYSALPAEVGLFLYALFADLVLLFRSSFRGESTGGGSGREIRIGEDGRALVGPPWIVGVGAAS